MRVCVLLLALSSVCACATSPTVAPSEGPYRFSGTVSAMNGQRVAGPIAGAHLTVTDGANASVSVTSDVAGRYVFDRLESGRFNVTIEAQGFVSASPVVDLYRDIEVDFALMPQ